MGMDGVCMDLMGEGNDNMRTNTYFFLTCLLLFPYVISCTVLSLCPRTMGRGIQKRGRCVKMK